MTYVYKFIPISIKYKWYEFKVDTRNICPNDNNLYIKSDEFDTYIVNLSVIVMSISTIQECVLHKV